MELGNEPRLRTRIVLVEDDDNLAVLHRFPLEMMPGI